MESYSQMKKKIFIVRGFCGWHSTHRIIMTSTRWADLICKMDVWDCLIIKFSPKIKLSFLLRNFSALFFANFSDKENSSVIKQGDYHWLIGFAFKFIASTLIVWFLFENCIVSWNEAQKTNSNALLKIISRV